MPISFRAVCGLFDDLESLHTRDVTLSPRTVKHRSRQILAKWFHQHRKALDAPETNLIALLSTLLPQQRTDRTFNLQPARLSALLGRCFRLGRSRQQDLERWKLPGSGTLPDCVERIQKQTPNQIPRTDLVTVEEVDVGLDAIALRCRHSKLRQGNVLPSSATAVEIALVNLYNRLTPRECKWLTALILKNLTPLNIEENLVQRLTHVLLPAMLRIRATYEASITSLIEAGLRSPTTLASEEDRNSSISRIHALLPMLGSCVGRPKFLFGRNVRHLTQVARKRRMSLERKYDGEYCQIHIDATNTGREIQIFSKSHRDSTEDRQKVHKAIRRSLRIGSSDCAFKKLAILEGELLVWSDEDKNILPFHKIRQHVRRSGVPLGAALDSDAPATEHLMIMFYDILRLDDKGFIREDYATRRGALRTVVMEIQGHAHVAEAHAIDFSSRNAVSQLLSYLSHAFAKHWEGYVMKPMHEPYLSIVDASEDSFRSSWFKIKKNYIRGLGDTVDMLIIGASYDSAEAARLGDPVLPWTHLHIACCYSSEAQSADFQPRYRVMHIINAGLSAADLRSVSVELRLRAAPATSSPMNETYIEWPYDLRKAKLGNVVSLQVPIVVELEGYGFEVPSNAVDLALRFPHIVKIKWDSPVSEALNHGQLQILADKVMRRPNEADLLSEIEHYRERLELSELMSDTKSAWWMESYPDKSSGDSGDRHASLCTPSPYNNAADAETALTISGAKEMQSTRSPPDRAALKEIQNPPAHRTSLQLVPKLSSSESYTNYIQRKVARRKRKLPETPPRSASTPHTISTEPSQVSVPSLKRRRVEFEKDSHSLRSSPKRNGTCVSISAPETSAIQPPLLTKSTVLLPRHVRDITLASMVQSDAAEVTKRFISSPHELDAEVTERPVILVNPRESRSAHWLRDIAKSPSIQSWDYIDIWDWRVCDWTCPSYSDESGLDPRTDPKWQRRVRQTYVARVERSLGEVALRWANGERTVVRQNHQSKS